MRLFTALLSLIDLLQPIGIQLIEPIQWLFLRIRIYNLQRFRKSFPFAPVVFHFTQIHVHHLSHLLIDLIYIPEYSKVSKKQHENIPDKKVVEYVHKGRISEGK